MRLYKNLVIGSSMMFIVGCAEKGPQKINVGKDQCDNCKMTIAEPKYATELITEKGRVYKFDDISCIEDYASMNAETAATAKSYVVDFPSGEFIEKNTATLIKGGAIKSPMGGNTQAFKDKGAAEKAAQELGATLVVQQ